jgi:hypothetical protein
MSATRRLFGHYRARGPRATRLLSLLDDLNTERDMLDMELVLLASELRTRANEILTKAASTGDPETQGMMRVVATGYEKLARQVEQRVREAEMA